MIPGLALYNRIVGNPFVYNHIRPLVVGGIDYAPFYSMARASTRDRILDIGCGTGEALSYISDIAAYLGVDIDSAAIENARRRFPGHRNVTFTSKLLEPEDVVSFSPTIAIMGGLLHHLTDQDAVRLLQLTRRSNDLVRVIAQDIVHVDGRPLSNFYARLDRGRYCRTSEGYHAIASAAGFRVIESEIVRCHPTRGLQLYHLMALARDLC